MDIVFDSSVVDLKSLNSPLFGKALTSPTKEMQGVLFKRGAINKSWKQRVFIMDSSSRVVFYFRDKKAQEPSLGFVPLWDSKLVAEETGSSSPRPSRGARSMLSVTAPFRRTFCLGFADEASRDAFRTAATKVRTNGRALDAHATNSWWRNNISKTGEDRVSWTRFSAALCRSFKVRLTLDAEASLCYVLNSLHRNDVKDVPPIDVVTLASVVEFVFLFGSLVEALEKLDGVLMSLTACSLLYAQKMVANAKIGTFVLFVASRPTLESLAVLGLVFIGPRNKVVHKHVFRDPVSRRFYTSLDEPAFARLDHLVASLIGVGETTARQTRLKLDELERIKNMITVQKLDTGSIMSISMSPLSPRQPRLQMPGGRSSSAAASGQNSPAMQRNPTAPVFDEIEKLLDVDNDSSDDAEFIAKLDELPQDNEDQNASVMMEQNLYCVSCGSELVATNKKFTTCGDCGNFLVDSAANEGDWRMPSASASATSVASIVSASASAQAAEPVVDVPFNFIRNDSITSEDAQVIQNVANSRKEAFLGLETSVQSWSEDMTKSFPK